ncbi:hypothetical protein IEQ34_001225 [Dendrobium chrysotoxum]|uniref:Uncharacterized protein n=1 Tax=Dendrobium chrysotoxum TaxID=161865 RepID=A0AAV7HPV8_DENCH|nr:hypothetical protein IEQ34_001225 [Dendrobium chrysotoxum]
MDPKMFDRKKRASSSYDKINKKLIPKRGFHNLGGQVMHMIVNQVWEPYAAIINIVREFFTNWKKAMENKCFARDKWVPFDLVSIYYTTFSLSPINYNEFLRVLCEPHSGALFKKREEKITNFLASYLT